CEALLPRLALRRLLHRGLLLSRRLPVSSGFLLEAVHPLLQGPLPLRWLGTHLTRGRSGDRAHAPGVLVELRALPLVGRRARVVDDALVVDPLVDLGLGERRERERRA